MRWLVLAVIVPVLALVVFAGYALAARFVLRGTITDRSLHQDVERASGSAGALIDDDAIAGDRCRPVERPHDWTCAVMDRSASGGAAYRIRVRPDNSCWDGRLSDDYSEGGMPGRITGCVNRWEWRLVDLMVD